jgi:hypothetical protein
MEASAPVRGSDAPMVIVCEPLALLPPQAVMLMASREKRTMQRATLQMVRIGTPSFELNGQDNANEQFIANI